MPLGKFIPRPRSAGLFLRLAPELKTPPHLLFLAQGLLPNAAKAVGKGLACASSAPNSVEPRPRLLDRPKSTPGPLGTVLRLSDGMATRHDY